MIIEADRYGAKIAVFPELGITAYTCGDLFFQNSLINQAKCAVKEIAERTADKDILSVVGLPLSVEDKLYNAAAFIKGGEVLGNGLKSL